MNRKTTKIIYWLSTIWLALGMLSTGVVQLSGTEAETDFITGLGYSDYVLALIAVWKILGVAAVLLPKTPLLKEWAYAGFFFLASGAVSSHIAADDGLAETAPSLLLLVLTITSWIFRPADKRLIPLKTLIDKP